MDTPTVLFTAVKALIRNDEGKVLVLKQSDPTISGHEKYHPPGGIIELGESVTACVLREVKEETGVECTVERVFDVGEWRAERDGAVMQFIGLFYICHIASYDFELQSDEVSGHYWVGLDDLDTIDLMEPSKSIIKNFLAE